MPGDAIAPSPANYINRLILLRLSLLSGLGPCLADLDGAPCVPREDMALHKVASDSTVTRPLRAEPASGRASPTGARKGFEDLLDIKAETPRTARTNRNNETRAADDRRSPRAENRARDDAERPSAPAEKNSTKPAAPRDTRQATDSQPSDTGEPASNVTAASPEDAAQQQFLALAEAAIVVGEGEAEPAAAEETAAPADEAEKVSDETGATVTVDVTTVDATTPETATPVAVALPTPEPAKTAPAPTTDEAAIAPVDLKAAAPAAPADGAPEAPADDATPEKIATPPVKDESLAEPAKPEAVKAEPVKAEAAVKTAPAQDAQKPAAPAAIALPETLAPKIHADHKPDAAKVKSGQPVAATPADAPAARDASAPAALEVDQGKALVAQAAKSAEQAPATPQALEARTESTPAPAAPSPATTSAITTNPPLHLNLSNPPILPTLSPLTALRVEAPAEAVPVAGLAIEIVARAQEGSRRFEIRLDPPELGRIDVRLDVDQTGKVSSRLVVERAETLDFLRRDAHQLERALQNAGLNTEGGLEFSLRDQSFANRDQSPRDGANPSRLIIPEDESVAAEAARRGYGRMIGLGGGVDIRV
jgi:flagellar hook-length control protein FliK